MRQLEDRASAQSLAEVLLVRTAELIPISCAGHPVPPESGRSSICLGISDQRIGFVSNRPARPWETAVVTNDQVGQLPLPLVIELGEL